MKKLLFLLLWILISPFIAFANTSKTHFYYEKEYQKAWCEKNCGAMEVVLPDKTRVDCVTKNHAIEFDFAKKWAEAIGQSLYYAEVLKKSPGVVLIVEDKNKDKKYIDRIKTIANKQSITLWLMFPEDI